MRKRNEEERAAQLMNCGTAGDSDNRGREQGEQRVEYVTDQRLLQSLVWLLLRGGVWHSFMFKMAEKQNKRHTTCEN